MSLRTLPMLLGVALIAAAVAAPAAPNMHAAGVGSRARQPAPTATPVPQPTPLPCGDCPLIHVEGIRMTGGKNANGTTYAVCNVFIKRVDASIDDPGHQLAGITVVHGWSGAVTATQVDVTAPRGVGGSDGTSTLVRVDNGPKCTASNPSRVYTCTVLNVYAPGYTYAPEFNIENAESDDACNPFD